MENSWTSESVHVKGIDFFLQGGKLAIVVVYSNIDYPNTTVPKCVIGLGFIRVGLGLIWVLSGQ